MTPIDKTTRCFIANAGAGIGAMQTIIKSLTKKNSILLNLGVKPAVIEKVLIRNR
jgi:hypothetical protein